MGGSGLGKLLSLKAIERITVDTPFGRPSDEIVLGELGTVPVAFLQRHGPGHRIPPSEINVRANVAALKHVGCDQIISLSAVGSLTEETPPGSFVFVDQFIDRTRSRISTYFETGLVGHVPFADPVCRCLHGKLVAVGAALSLSVAPRGTYIVMEGPQFSSRAESNLYRQWGGTVIGMTGMPEAKLAREAEVCYAMVAMPTDYDCWFSGDEDVTADLVSKRMKDIAIQANALVEKVCAEIYGELKPCPAGCHAAQDTAIMTHPDHWDAELVSRLRYVMPRLDAIKKRLQEI